MDENIINWLEDWYYANCNDEWEHNYGVKIDTIDNPGWSISIDLAETKFSKIEIERVHVEIHESDWYSFSVRESIFKGFGSINRLSFLLKKFKDIIES
jgi:hypothetical protein